MKGAHDLEAVILRWAPGPGCIGLARAELRRHLGHWGLTAIAEDSALVLSELLTNSVLHASKGDSPSVETHWLRLPHGLRLEISDGDSTGRPVRHRPDPECESGRGLDLVSALADAWGVNPRSPVGKTVWAELSTGRR
jgi:serine/threonine-protein kinase RsbW